LTDLKERIKIRSGGKQEDSEVKITTNMPSENVMSFDLELFQKELKENLESKKAELKKAGFSF
jgi:hypothetical protein